MLMRVDMSILTALLQGIKDRSIDNFFELEETITKLSKAQILEIINDKTKGKEPMDKVRLFMIWFLSTEQDIARADVEKFDDALRTAGADKTALDALTYIRR
jgi:hypothetical protein